MALDVLQPLRRINDLLEPWHDNHDFAMRWYDYADKVGLMLAVFRQGRENHRRWKRDVSWGVREMDPDLHAAFRRMYELWLDQAASAERTAKSFAAGGHEPVPGLVEIIALGDEAGAALADRHPPVR